MKLWDRFTALAKSKAATSAELKASRAEFITDRERLAGEIEEANGRKAEVLRNGGPAALKPYQDKVREITDQLEAHDLAIAEIDRQIAEAEKVEQAAAFEQRAAAASKAMGDLEQLRETFFQQIDALMATMYQGAALTVQVRNFNREPGASGRKVVDRAMVELHEAAKPVLPLEHPMLDQALAKHLEAAASFKRLQARFKTAA